MSENLSKYFSDNASIFDKITAPEARPGGTAMEQRQEEMELNVPDEVRDKWHRPDIKDTVSLLTSPGIMPTADFDVIPIATGSAPSEMVSGPGRSTLRMTDVTQDERGLRKLIEEDCFRAAVDLTTRLLTMYGQGPGRLGQPAKHTPHSLQLWFTRFSLLVKLGLFDVVNAEAEAFGQLSRPDVFYEFYPEMYSGRTGSMASFSFRLLLAELAMYTAGQEKVALERCSTINAVCEQLIAFYTERGEPQNAQFWRRRHCRVLQSIINCSLAMKNYDLVHTLMQRLLDLGILSPHEMRELNSTWFRVYLQSGDIFNADQKLSESRRLAKLTNTSDSRDLIDRGLRSLAQSDFEEALVFFQNASKMDPHNATIVNNIAVCQLYTGKLEQAIKTYESAFDAAPAKMNEYVDINLALLRKLYLP